MKINVLDLKGNKIETIDFAVESNSSVNSVIRYLRSYLSNQRQGTSAVKTRSMVRGGGKKPWKQKGTGRARAGSIRSPLWVGGGRSHGPSPKSWRSGLPKSAKASSFKFALESVLNNEALSFVDFASFEKVSSKNANQFVVDASFDKDTILLVHNNNDILSKSFRNLKNTSVVDIKSLNTHDLVRASKVIVEKEAVEMLKEKTK